MANLSLPAVRWKDIPQGGGKYEIGTSGFVRNKKTKRILIPDVTYSGYHRVRFKMADGKYKNYFLHRLVASAFIPNPDNKPQINHLDGVRSNNLVGNLEWSTKLENIQWKRNIKKGRKISLDELDEMYLLTKKSGIKHAAKVHNIEPTTLGKLLCFIHPEY